MSEEIYNKIENVKRLIEEGSFGLAYRLLKEVGAEIDADETDSLDYEIQVAYQELEQQIHTQSRLEIQDARAYLDTLTDMDAQHIGDFEYEEAQALLKQWRNAVLGESDAQLAHYEAKVRRLQDNLHDLQAYVRVQEEVADYWNNAQNLRRENPDVAVGTILGLYDKALSVARDSASANPDNYRLQALLAQAEARRDHLAFEEQAMTSGALLGKVRDVLSHIERTPTGEMVQVYDILGNPIGARTKEEARQIILGQAPNIAAEHANRYLNEAEKYLDNFAPRETLKVLERRENIEEYLDPGKRIQLDELEREARDHLRQLEQAEVEANAAADALETAGALAVWGQFQYALTLYEGARVAPVIRRVEENILARANTELQSIRREIESLIQQERLLEASQYTDQMIGNYRELGPRVHQLPALEQLRSQAQSRFRIKEGIHTTLERIERNVKSNQLNEAVREFELLELEHADSGLLQDTVLSKLYQRVRDAISLRADAEGHLNTLALALNSNNRSRVAVALEAAREGAETTDVYQDRFDRLAEELGLHLRYLDAVNLREKGQYEGAIEIVEELLGALTLPQDRRMTLRGLLDNLREVEADRSANQSILAKAESLLDDNPKQAFMKLRRFRPGNYDEQRRMKRIMKQAQHEWLDQVDELVRQMDIEDPPDVEEIDEYMDDLRELDDELYQQYEVRLLIYRLVREAMNEEDLRRYPQALSKLKDALKNATGRESRYINERIAELQRVIKGEEKANLLQQVENAYSHDQALLAQLIAMKNDLMALSNMYDDFEYEFWLLEVMMAEAQYTPDARISRNLFSQAAAVAYRLTPKLRARGMERDPDIQQVVNLAQVGAEVGQARLAIESHLKSDSDIGLFIEAVETWKQIFRDNGDALTYLQRWYNDRASDVREQLRVELFGKEVAVENMEARARLLVLREDDDMGQAMLKRLGGLQAQLEQDTENFIQNLTSSQGYTSRQGMKFLQRQIDTLLDHSQRLETTARVLERFKGMEALKREGDSLFRASQRCRRQIDQGVSQLRELQNLAHDCQAYLDTLGDNIIQYEVEDYWRRFVDQVQRLSHNVGYEALDVDFSQHPIVLDLEKNKDELFATHTELENGLQRVRVLFEAEAYGLALIQAADVVRNQLQRSRNRQHFAEKARNFFVIDPMTQQRIQGWDDVADLIDERKRRLDMVLKWAATFEIPDAELPETIEKPKAENDVVDWPEVLKRAELLHHRAQFEESRIEVEQAVVGTGTHTRVIPLQEAYEHVQSLPLAYEHAGSRRGQRIMHHVQAQNLEPLYEAIQEANEFIRHSHWVEGQVEVIRSEFQQALKMMVDNSGFFNRRQHEEGRYAGEQAIKRLRTICRNHPSLSQMEELLQEHSH